MADTTVIPVAVQVTGAETAKTASDALKALSAAADSATAALGRVAERSKAAKGSATEAASGLDKMGQSALGMAEGATKAGGATGKLQELLAKLGPEGAAAAAALGVLAIAITATVGALLGMADAAISVIEKRAALLATFSALAGGEAGGAKTLAMVQKLGQSLPFATSQIGDWAKSLMSAGLQGKSLEGAIKAVAAAQALMGEGGAHAAQELIKKLAEGGAGATKTLKTIQEGGPKANKALAEMGLQVRDLAKAMGMTPEQFAKAKIGTEEMAKAIEKALAQKGKGPLDELGSTFPVMIAKVKEGFFSLFSGLGPSVKPFMAAVKSLFSEFYKGGSVITFLKPLVTSVMSTLFSWATKAVNALHGVMGALLSSGKSGGMLAGAVSALKSAWSTVLTIFHLVVSGAQPLISSLKAIFSNAAVLDGLKMIFKGIAIAIGVVVVVVAAVTAAFAALVGLIAAGIAGAVGVIAGFVSKVAGAGARIISAVKGWAAAFSGVGRDMVSGLVNALMGGIGRAVAAAVNLAKSALMAAKAAVGSNSPAKAFIQLGNDMGAGQVIGVKAQNDNAARAGTNLAKATAAGAAKGAAVADVAKPAAAGQGGGQAAQKGGDTYHVTIMQPPGATKQQGADFAEGFVRKMRDLAA